jgi:hypothetical protein
MVFLMYVHVKELYYMAMKEIHCTILTSDHRSIIRRNVWGTIVRHERKQLINIDRQLIGKTLEAWC